MGKGNCKHCHSCGTKLRIVLDGEEWCDVCQTYRRYKSHGWGSAGDGNWECHKEGGAHGTAL